MKEVQYKDYLICKLESGTIKRKENGVDKLPVKPILRSVSKEIDVDINNGRGNLKTTRALGNDVIKQLLS